LTIALTTKIQIVRQLFYIVSKNDQNTYIYA